MRQLNFMLIFILSFMLTACGTTTIHQGQQSQRMSRNAQWGVLPFENNTEIPRASEKATAMVVSVLQTKGINHIIIYRQASCNQLLGCSEKQLSTRQILSWAQKNRISYVIQGSVNEWRYKVGLDGEPSVNITLTILNAKDNHVIWNAVGSKTGGSRSGLGDIGQQLIVKMLSKLDFLND